MPSAGATLGQRIRAAYMQAGLNRSQFCRMMDIHYTTAISWEKDKTRPNADHLRGIADVTGTTVAALMGDGEPVPEHTDPALTAFLETRQGRTVTDNELRMLRSIRAYGADFQESTYQGMLTVIRGSAVPSQDDIESDREIEEQGLIRKR